MGWKKYLNAKNILAVAAAPFTAGTSLALLNDGKGNDLLGEITGKNSAKQANKQNLAQQNYWNERNIAEQKAVNEQSIELANSAHQREVADLKAAGLNPVLSAGGNGATTPSLGAGVGTAATVDNTMPGGYLAQIAQVANVANTFSSAKSLAQNAKLANAQTANTEIQTELATPLAKAEIANKMAGAGSAKAQAAYTEAMKEAQEIENKYHNDTGTANDMPTTIKTAKNVKKELNSSKTTNSLINKTKSIRNKIRAKVLK